MNRRGFVDVLSDCMDCIECLGSRRIQRISRSLLRGQINSAKDPLRIIYTPLVEMT